MYKTLTIGMRDHYFAVLQAGLNMSLPGETPLAVDGIFWTQTQGRVKKFQREKQLETDGIVGPLTWGKLLEAGSDPSSPFLCDQSCDNGNPEHEGSAGMMDSSTAAGQQLRDPVSQV